MPGGQRDRRAMLPPTPSSPRSEPRSIPPVPERTDPRVLRSGGVLTGQGQMDHLRKRVATLSEIGPSMRPNLLSRRKGPSLWLSRGLSAVMQPGGFRQGAHRGMSIYTQSPSRTFFSASGPDHPHVEEDEAPDDWPTTSHRRKTSRIRLEWGVDFRRVCKSGVM